MTGRMVFEQITGSRRSIVLRGRSMCYRPISLTRTQRTTTTWLPANPKAVQQVIGPTFEPTTITGVWKDKYLGSDTSSVQLLNFPRLSPAAQGVQVSASTFIGTNAFAGIQPAKFARVVVDAFEMMLAEGQDIRWQWGQWVRYGKLKRFVFSPGTHGGSIEDIGWELELEWSGDVEAPTFIIKKQVNLLATASGMSTLLAGLLEALDKLQKLLAQPNNFVNQLLAPMATLTGLITGLINALRQVVTIVNLPNDLAKTVSGFLQAIKDAARGLANLIDQIRSGAGEAARSGAADATQIAALVHALLRKRLVEIASYCTEQNRLLALFEGDEVLATFFADSATSLRDVSTKYYGDPREWTRISNFNAFYSSTVTPGTLVRVPRLA